MVLRTGIRYDRLDRSSDIEAADQTIPAKEVVQYCSTYEKISIPDYCGVLSYITPFSPSSKLYQT